MRDGSDSSIGLLTAEHSGATAVTVVVTDNAGQTATVNYPMTPRSSCWFAYTTWTATGGAKLEVVDPILETTPPAALSHNHDVYDFAFSPNGKYLSYRFAADADHEQGKYLAVVDLATWNDLQLSLSDDPGSASDAVTAYAWSANSSTLAATFLHGGAQYLGGVRFAADGQLSKLTPRQTAVDSDLYWIGSSIVAYYANGIADFSTVPPQLEPFENYVTGAYSLLTGAGFEQATLFPDAYHAPPIFVQIASDGFFLNSPSLFGLVFNWIQPGGPPASRYHMGIASPSARITAALTSGTLNLYHAENDHDSITTNASDRDCPKLLTWAEERERMACVRTATNDQGAQHSELRVFDLAADDTLSVAPVEGYCENDPQSSATTSACTGKYEYTIANSESKPRIFSRSGAWLAFVSRSASSSASTLYVADLRTMPFHLKSARTVVTLTTAPTSPIKLAFSPDEALLLGLIEGTLAVYSVSGDAAVPLRDFDPDSPDSNPICSEDFATQPDRWCGSGSRDAPFKWDPTSRFAVYRGKSATDPEMLTITDLTHFPEFDSHDFHAPGCNTHCNGKFAFQP